MDLDVQKAQLFQELQQASVVTGASAKPLAAKFSPRFKVLCPGRPDSDRSSFRTVLASHRVHCVEEDDFCM